jgi:hypothetical protein
MNKGDLGFLSNSRGTQPNRGFFGSTGHPSKKGVIGVSQVSKINNFENTESTTLKPASEQMINKRTEWLESQERKISATLQETRGNTNRIADGQSELKSGIDNLQTFVHKQGQKLFDCMQSLYGKVSSSYDLLGFPCGSDDDDDMMSYVSGKQELLSLAKKEKWVYLIYPQLQVEKDGLKQTMMRCKIADKSTGQLALYWVIIHEQGESSEKRYISEFDLLPQ